MEDCYEFKCEDCNGIAKVRDSRLFYCASCWFKIFSNRRKTNGK